MSACLHPWQHSVMMESGESHARGFNVFFKSLSAIFLVRLVLTRAILLLVVAMPYHTQAAPEYAPIMPKAKTSLLIDLAAVGSRVVSVGERGHVLFSDDKGESWVQGKMPFLRMLTGVSFVNEKLGWAVGHQSMIFHTTNGGETWALQLEGFNFQRRVNTDNLARAEQAYAELSAQLGVTPDQGRELELEDALFALEDAQFYAEQAPVPTNFHDVLFLDQNRGWAVGAFGRLVQTTDGGKTWVDITHLVATEEGFHLNAITANHAGALLIAGEAGVLFRSLDDGRSWLQLDSGNDGSFFGITHSEVSGVTTTFGLGGSVFQSTDFGDSWVQLDSGITSALAGGAITANGNTVLVGTGGLILTINGKDSSITAHPQSDRQSLSAVLPLSSGGYILAGTGGVKRVQLSDDSTHHNKAKTNSGAPE